MSESDKPFPPSDHRLSELRRQGIVPYSRDITSAGAIAGAALAVYFSGGSLAERWSALFGSASVESYFALLSESLVKLAFPAAAGAAFAALLQTKFLFVFGKARKTDRTGPVLFLLGVCKLAAWLGLAALLYFSIVSDFRGGQAGVKTDLMLEGSAAASIMQGASLLKRIAGAALVYFIFVALISWFSSWLAFRRRHSMTRAEVEAEARELEPRPEMRHARASLD